MIEEKGCYIELLHQMIQLPPLDQRQTIFMSLRCISKYSSWLPAAPRIFEYLKSGIIAHF